MRDSLRQAGAKKNRAITLALVAAGCVSLVVALLIGVGDNPPGLVLCYIAATGFVVAWVHTWRTVRRFLILLGASLIGFPVFTILHNLFYALGEVASGVRVLAPVLASLEVAFFLIAVLVCPPGVLVGAVGSAILAIIHFKGKRISDDPTDVHHSAHPD
jgi:hypothetical protein